ncbi:radical SAM family heme chaperone HemW [Namhaeicola litoreus]|uniref:Heme chaperone HemW n=1 Tax=Namhaeicola litoreus TaxID=1052145 RepID=A0ABW3XZQ3_9FLAO
MAGIYIHIPFCKQACFYCDFHFSTSLKHKTPLLEALAKEIVLKKNECDEEIETIYFGGGTPSLLKADEIDFLLQIIYDNYLVSKNAEISLEANPDDLDKEKIVELSKTKINRLSIGIQSFFDEDLVYMNRAHTAKEAKKSLIFAKQYFDNITIDLIYGIPGLSNKRWIENIQTALDLGIPHLSCYALTVEEKTALARFIKSGKYQPLNEELASEQFQILCEMLHNKGYVQYEISNFGLPNYFSQHNSAYWKGVIYLGIGPSAHSYDGKKRGWNISNNVKYVKALKNNQMPLEIEELSLFDRMNEKIMIGLRTIWGISLPEFENEFGKDNLNSLLKVASKHIKDGMLIEKADALMISQQGKFYADGIAADLFFIDEND